MVIDILEVKDVVQMKKALAVVAFAAVLLLAVSVGQAFDIEGKLGTSGALTIAAELDVLTNLTIGASFGVTGLLTGQQTPSYTLGLTAKYWPFGKRPQFAPYVGVGGYVELQNLQMRLLLNAVIGARYYITSRFFGLAEAAFFFPVLDIAAWYSDLVLGVGYRF
ncbi:hypothetical protein KAX17_18440 [Candidatus Bipolaricaulota bacterium]|nr:hypothetical protein [Candidatus Bipolaricaulota bacterium]